MRVRVVAALVAFGAAVAACGGDGDGEDVGGTTASATIVVQAPFTGAPSVARPIERGARLAAEEHNRDGGVAVAGGRVRLRVVPVDNRSSAETAVANVRRAVADGAVAVVDEGTGVDASWRVAADAGLPIGIVHQGGIGLVDPDARPNVFRVAPTDRGTAYRLAEHLVPTGARLALVTDDSEYGSNGAAALERAFRRDPAAVATVQRISSAPGADPAPQVLAARQAGATGLLVWAEPGALAAVVRAARSTGWRVPVYAAGSGGDPVLRQQLADRPDWIDGLTFTASRLTAEVGPEPWERFRAAYERRFGVELAGVRTSAGRDVVVPPERAMYAYDLVHLLAAAITRAGAARPGPVLLRAMENVDVPGANGDERGFNERNHEGVVDDDVFFARFDDMVWHPVDDDVLSSTLPGIPQTR